MNFRNLGFSTVSQAGIYRPHLPFNKQHSLSTNDPLYDVSLSPQLLPHYLGLRSPGSAGSASSAGATDWLTFV